VDNLREYETFQNVSEMDSFLSEVLSYLELSEIERKLLRLLAGHSCKFVGVSWLKVDTMANALEVSSKTIQRALKRMKELGIIKRVRTLRPIKGGFGASLTLICPVALSYREEAEKSAPEPAQKVSEQKETFIFKAFKKDLKHIRQHEIDYTYLEEWLPFELIQAVKPFVSPEEAFSLWGKVQVASRKYAPSVSEIIKPAIRAFKATVLAYQRRRIKGSFGGYFWGALTGVFSVEQRKLSLGNFWNWLE
jgi:DNA-binding Lrp family transcriptional regulator